ncbi:MAG: hypothetical protein AVO38_10850 [delta proteobacterium ML8_D]|jgi:uncharacterized membrane protein|nr:MAG: hypothetical protein AVO38_10850 [delta proteobacterium ML8_D]
MKKKLFVSALIVAVSMWSVAYAYNAVGPLGCCGKGSLRQDLLAQLPAEKETLFHRTMREVRKKGSEIREQMMIVRQEIEDIIVAEPFEEDLFREKTSDMQDLQKRMHSIMEDAVATLAKQFTADERKVLIKLLPDGMVHHGRHATKWRHK